MWARDNFHVKLSHESVTNDLELLVWILYKNCENEEVHGLLKSYAGHCSDLELINFHINIDFLIFLIHMITSIRCTVQQVGLLPSSDRGWMCGSEISEMSQVWRRWKKSWLVHNLFVCFIWSRIANSAAVLRRKAEDREPLRQLSVPFALHKVRVSLKRTHPLFNWMIQFILFD